MDRDRERVGGRVEERDHVIMCVLDKCVCLRIFLP